MLRFALVGCGRIAKRHADILHEGQVKRAQLGAVYDCQPERARSFGEHYGVPHFTDFDQMMGEMRRRIDVVTVLTPSGDHAATSIAVARYGKHVVVEKPMALTLADADAMIEACDAAGVKLFVVKQNRFNLPVQKLRQAIEAGRFGKLVLGTVRVRWCRDQSYYDQDPWRGTWAEDGGVFANQASHHVDLLEWMMGDVESVFAKSTTALANIQVEDTGIVLVKFRNGALGSIEATTATRPVDLEGSISVLGERGSVEIGGFAVNHMRTWRFSQERPDDADVLKHYSENPPGVYGFGHARYLDDVVASVLDGKKPAVDGREGRKSLRLITAIYESIEKGREVAMHAEPSHSRLGRRP
jgi:predicted dehydrogenase